MIYRNITLSILSEFVRNVENLKKIYSTVTLFSYEEMLGFILLQQNHAELRYYMTEEHPEVFQSIVDKLASVDSTLASLCMQHHSTLTEEDVHRFEQRFSVAQKIRINVSNRNIDTIHDFERQKKKLLCDMDETEIIELAQKFELRTSASFKQNFLNPIISYMKEEIGLNLADTINPLLIDNKIRDIDFTSVLTAKDFKDIDHLRDYLNAIFPAIGQNMHTNRCYLAALLSYLGVMPEEILQVRSSDLSGNILTYKHKKIELTDDCMAIINQWNETGCYYMIKTSEAEPLQQSPLLIKSHKAMSPTLMTSILKDYSTAKNIDYYTMRDIYRSGEYDRYRRTKCNEVSESRRRNFIKDYAAWERTFFPADATGEPTEEPTEN